MRSSSSSTASCRALAPLAVLALALWPRIGVAQEDDGWGDGFGGSEAAEVAVDAWANADADTGRRLFRVLCAGCHGALGDGQSRVAAAMFPAPRDLTRGEYRFRSTASGKLPLRDDLFRTLSRGLPGTVMPSWQDQLTERERRSLVLYLETLSPRFALEPRDPADVVADVAGVEPPPPTPALVERGREVYARMKCGQCHGERGRGDGTAAPTLENTDGTPSHVFDFTYGVYKGGHEPTDVYRTFMTGLTGTPMPAFDQSLPDEVDRWALVYYCLSLGRDRDLWFYLSERPTWREPIAGGGAEP